MVILNRRSSRSALLSYVALLLGCGPLGMLATEPDRCIKIEGTLTYTVSLPQNRGNRREEYSFAVRSEPKSWHILLIPNDAKTRPLTRLEVGFDGEHLYKYAEQNQEAFINPTTNNVPIVPRNRGFAQIIPDDVPPPDPFRAEPLWLAYCSSYHFRTNHAGTARQLWPSSSFGTVPYTNIQVKAQWEWLPPGDRFLSKLTYFKLVAPGKYLPHVLYDVKETKLLGARGVPTVAEFVRLSELNLAVREPLARFECRATNVAYEDSLLDARPRLTVPVIMMDYRFLSGGAPVGYMQYLVTNGLWPSETQLKRSKDYRLAEKIARGTTGIQSGPLRLVLVGIALATAALFAFLRVRGVRKNEN